MTTTPLHQGLTLAQIFEPALPSTPDAPFVETWFTGSGLPGAAAAALLGIALFVILRRSAKPGLGAIALVALLAVCVGILALGRMVVTQRETLAARTNQLIVAAGTNDEPTLRSVMHPDVRLSARNANAQGIDRVVALSTQAKGLIDSISTKEIRVDPRGDRVARTLVTVRVEGGTLPRLSQWSIDWQIPEPGDPWVAVDMEAIWIQGLDNPQSAP